jgi:MFS family permease
MWNRAFLALIVVNFFRAMAQFMTNVTIPLYADSMGASASVIGMVVGIFAVTALGIRPFAGPAFDSFSKKRMLMIAIGFNLVAMVLYGFATSVPALVVVRLIHGVGIGMGGPVSMALVAEHVPDNRLASGLSIFSISQAVAQVIAPACGLWLVEALGYSGAYWIGAAAVACSFLSIFVIPEQKGVEREPYRLSLSRMFAKEAVPATIALLLLSAAQISVGTYVVLYGEMVGLHQMGLYFTIYAITMIATRPLFGRLADRWGAELMLLPTTVIFAASFIMLVHMNTLPMLVATAIVAGMGFGSCVPLVQTISMQKAPANRRGAASNTSFIGLDTGALIGPVVAGHIIDGLVVQTGSEVVAYQGMWYAMIVPIAIALAMIVSWVVRARKAQ